MLLYMASIYCFRWRVVLFGIKGLDVSGHICPNLDFNSSVFGGYDRGWWGIFTKTCLHCRITALSGDSREISFLFQRVSVLCSDLTPFCCGRVLLQTAARMMTYRVIHLAKFFPPSRIATEG